MNGVHQLSQEGKARAQGMILRPWTCIHPVHLLVTKYLKGTREFFVMTNSFLQTWTYLTNSGGCTMRSETHQGGADAIGDAKCHTALVPFRLGRHSSKTLSCGTSALILQFVFTFSMIQRLVPSGWYARRGGWIYCCESHSCILRSRKDCS